MDVGVIFFIFGIVMIVGDFIVFKRARKRLYNERKQIEYEAVQLYIALNENK